MCRFKSGIILRDRCVLTDGFTESHTELLKQLNIDDTFEHAEKVFVRAELIPNNGKYNSDMKDWTFHVDQDIVPDWFTKDKEKYEEEFRIETKKWIEKHIIRNKHINCLNDGFCILVGCEVEDITGDVAVILDNTSVAKVYEGVFIGQMIGKSTVSIMRNATVSDMFDCSVISNLERNSFIRIMHDNSHVDFVNVYGRNYGIRNMNDNSSIGTVTGETRIATMEDYASIEMMCSDSSVFEMKGCSSIKNMKHKSNVSFLREKSTIGKMTNSSYVRVTCDSSEIQDMIESSSVSEMYHNSAVNRMEKESFISTMYNFSKIKEMFGRSTVIEMKDDSSVQIIHDNATAHNYEKGVIYKSKESNLKIVNV